MTFPVSPTDGQSATVNGIRYTYNSTDNAWYRQASPVANLTVSGNVITGKLFTADGLFWAGNGQVIATGGGGGGGVFTASNIAPAGPNTSDFWYKINIDTLYQYITDGTSSYWVDIQSPILFANTASTTFSALGETSITGNLIPTANITYSLGSEQFQWKDLWVSNNTIYLGNTPIRVDNGVLLVNNAPVTGSGSGVTYTANTAPPTTGNISGDKWYDTNADILYEYLNDGTTSYWIDISSQTIAANTSTELAANVGAYQIYANASIVTTQANLGAFQTYANAKIGTNTNSNLVVIAATTSTSTTTGALVVAGGAGIAGNVYAGALYDNGSRTATTGKAIAMSIVFGG
jgi:hypothetical protein